MRQLNDLGTAKSHLQAASAEGYSTQIQSEAISAMQGVRHAGGIAQNAVAASAAARPSGSRRSGSGRRSLEKNAPRPDIQGERKPGPDTPSAGLARMLGNIGAVKLPVSA